MKAQHSPTGFVQPDCTFATGSPSPVGGRSIGPVIRLGEATAIVRLQQHHTAPAAARGMTHHMGVEDPDRTDALALTDLRIHDSHRLSAIREGGLKFTLGLAAGTHSIQLRILLDTNDQTPIYAVSLGTSTEPGLCPVILEVRELSAGDYILEATPCDADGTPGTTSRHTFAVVD